MFGWPGKDVYDREELDYFSLLEKDRELGIIQIEGIAQTWEEYIKNIYLESKDSLGWDVLFESFDEEDRDRIINFALSDI